MPLKSGTTPHFSSPGYMGRRAGRVPDEVMASRWLDPAHRPYYSELSGTRFAIIWTKLRSSPEASGGTVMIRRRSGRSSRRSAAALRAHFGIRAKRV